MKPSECRCAAVADELQRAVIFTLLSSEGYGPFSLAELGRELSGSKGRPIDLTTAIERLHAAGLVNVSGELVSPSRAAVHMDGLLGGAV